MNAHDMIKQRSIIIGIVAGEVSGDILGASLIRELRKYLKTVFFFGIGGNRMRLENMECWYDITELSIMGIVEIISKLPRVLYIRSRLLHKFRILKPDIFIGIDFPDFNIFLEKRLKKNGICTVHYVSPSVWAWRKNRIFALKTAADIILLLFPFERIIYDQFNIPCQFIGHTLADKIPLNPNKTIMRKKLHLSQHKKYLALLPGSRMMEIKMLTNIFLTCAKLLNDSIPNLEVLVSLHSQELINYFIKLSSSIKVKFKVFNTQNAWEIMVASDLALVSAGTITLECMLAKCPMVVGYRINPITFFLIKNFIKTSCISLPNLLAGYNLVQEFIQNDCNPKKLTEALLHILSCDSKELEGLRKKFYELQQSIRLNADKKAVDIILKYLPNSNT